MNFGGDAIVYANDCVQELCRETWAKKPIANSDLTRGQLSPLDTERRARGYPTIIKHIQPCPKRGLLMPLARVGARTDSTTRSTTRVVWRSLPISRTRRNSQVTLASTTRPLCCNYSCSPIRLQNVIITRGDVMVSR